MAVTAEGLWLVSQRHGCIKAAVGAAGPHGASLARKYIKQVSHISLCWLAGVVC